MWQDVKAAAPAATSGSSQKPQLTGASSTDKEDGYYTIGPDGKLIKVVRRRLLNALL